MGKLKAPLLSLGASGAIGKVAVFFNWKGIDAVREYVIPANPKSDAQQTQRGYVTSAVAAIHLAEQDATKPLVKADTIAYALWARALGITMTWFNTAVRNYVKQKVAGLNGCPYGAGGTTPGDGELAVTISIPIGGPVNGAFWYGTSITAMLSSKAAIYDGIDTFSETISGLTNGIKYYWQFRPTTAAFVGAYSGIYHGTPSA